ncbi:response regulator [Dyadobacter flavalbus]|uniref:Response regulator n=1 Tax=Dyadobacter flavalbus TaxID=2579942 RepID=A0A5M8R2Z4_9BACT|nr:response regulator [Dyadobacter flavalbus]KAA6441838.1 response regulator [Dyadobacter flavalbus]
MSQQLDFLLIDDSSFVLMTYEVLLERSGMAKSVKAFNVPRNALKYIKKHGEQLVETVILLDLQMPDMDGFEFIEGFETLPETIRNKIKIFMITSSMDPQHIEQAKANPLIMGLFAKPLEMDTLKLILSM